MAFKLFGKKNKYTGADISVPDPKPVMGITKMMLPLIARDFPGFSWDEWKIRCEDMLLEYLSGFSNEQMNEFAYVSENLKREIQRILEQNINEGVIVRYENLRLYQTEIIKYEKEGDVCVIQMKTSVTFIYSANYPREVFDIPTERLYVMELRYREVPETHGEVSKIVLDR